MVREPWSRLIGERGQVVSISQRDVPALGVSINVKHEQDEIHEGLSATWRCALQLKDIKSHAILKIANYWCGSDGLKYQLDGGPEHKIEVSQSAIFFPLMRVFTGDAVAATLKLGGRATWVVPSIAQLGKNSWADLFVPDISQRHARPHPTLPHTIMLSGGPYETAELLSLAAHGQLQSYSFNGVGDDTKWTCRLVSADR